MGNAESSSSELNPTSSRWINESSSSSYGRRSESKKSAEEEEDGELSSSLMAGAAVAGTALLALGAWKLATSSSSSSSSEEEEDAGTRTLKFMTYNVWMQEKVSLDRRIEAIGELIKKHSPDVIMFQEVTPHMIEIFQKSEWRMDYKYVLPQIPRADRGSFCIMMSNIPMKLELMESDELDESKYCVASIKFRGRTLGLATCHLKSPSQPKTLSKEKRENQADELRSKFTEWQNVVLGGDMNWNEDGVADWRFPWVDAWPKLRPREPGYTYDTVRNKMIANKNIIQKRLDRFFCKLQDFKLEGIKLIGTEAIVGDPVSYRGVKVPLWPSDHFGLVLTISSK